MRFVEVGLPGAFLIEPERIRDDRGFFARLWCEHEFNEHGMKARIVQSNVGFSPRAGTLRGLHFQNEPHAEVKVVRCSRGAVFDVIVDLRPESPTLGQWFGSELSAENGKTMYVPEGFAQGYLTLVDTSEVYYHTSEFYCPEAASGVRYNDPVLGIEWPAGIEIVSDQDRSWPDFTKNGPGPFRREDPHVHS